MITIVPSTEVALGHRAYHVAVAESGHVAAVSREGVGTFFAPDHTTCTTFRLPADAGDVAISAAGSLLAVTARGRLTLISTSTFRPVLRLNESFECSCFNPAGALWSAARWDEDSVAVEIRERETWRVVARAELTDPFRDSSFSIMPHADGEHVAIWAAAGQDGQCLFWAHRDGSQIIFTRFPGVESTTPPSFTPSGDRFLVVCDLNELREYIFPLGPLHKKMPWPFDDMDNQIGERVSYAGSTHALLHSTADRLYLVDLRKMAITDEVSLRGHAPKPAAEVYPKLGEELGLCSDLGHFAPLPTGGFLSVHHGAGHDSLLTWHLPPRRIPSE